MSECGLRILLVEDNPADAYLLEETLLAVDERLAITRVEGLGQAVEFLARQPADAILLDLALPDSEGLATLERASAAAPHLPIIVLTGLDDELVATEAVREGAQNYLVKGETPPHLLLRTIHHAVERKRLETALAEAKAAAEAANLAKSQFLANMSHELRTPMNSILGMTDLALREQLSPEVRDYLQTVKESADGLVELLDDLLDLSRIEAGALTLELTEFPLRAMLDRALRPLSFRAHQKGLELVHEVVSEVPDRLVGDPLRLRQVITNLVANAIKFTHEGQIAVRVGLGSSDLGSRSSDLALRSSDPRPKSEDRSQICNLRSEICNLRFEISDTGIGISAKDQQRIFAPFTQADASTTRKYGGTGLGLTISRRLVDLMGGQIWVESQPRRGSTFYFTVRLGRGEGRGTRDWGLGAGDEGSGFRVQGSGLVEACPGRSPAPLAPSPQPPNPASSAFDPFSPTAHPLRVLLAEDTPANRKLIAMLLQKRGHTVELAADGQLALELAGRQHFDVVLMDVQMPRMDGFHATAAIRKLADPVKARVPIIAMTAHALKGDRERCLEAGMDAYVSKPVRAEEIIETLERLAARGGREGTECEMQK